MKHRRILSIWLPYFGAERVLRRHRGVITRPFAIISESSNSQTIDSISPLAASQGITIGQALSDARALCPDLLTSVQDKLQEKQFIAVLQRWAGQFSPWVSPQGETGLSLDISGCSHLFGGEDSMISLMSDQLSALHLTSQIGIADTLGASWALARFGHQPIGPNRTGDAIQQEAHATRSRAFKRKNWERGGTRPHLTIQHDIAQRIAPPGRAAQTIAPLPIAALRLSEATALGLSRLGIKQISDLIALPRSTIARRFGADVLLRLDQATGMTPEPISPISAAAYFATRLSFPDPIGLPEDISEGITRLIHPLCQKLKEHEMGCRKIQLTLMRSDGTYQIIEAGLARPGNDADRILPLLTMQLPKIEPGYGIDVMRLQVITSEPLSTQQHSGPFAALEVAQTRRAGQTAQEDLIGRIGARIGLEQITQLHIADSTIPEKAETTRIVAYSDEPQGWHAPSVARPVTLFRPEPVRVTCRAATPKSCIWRRQSFSIVKAQGPERIAPEWWLDDPDWRGGTRDYWKVTTNEGPEIWLFKAQTGEWSCHGVFA